MFSDGHLVFGYTIAGTSLRKMIQDVHEVDIRVIR
jgi:hypothetical protein